MPVQKGKRRNRSGNRHRLVGASSVVPVEPASAVETPAGSEAKSKRRRWEPPVWLNLIVGLFLAFLAGLFLVTPHKGYGSLAFITVFLYLALSLLYLGKAYRQYRKRRLT